MAGILRVNVSFVLAAMHYEHPLIDPIVDYNSWIESDTGRKLANSLDKDVVLAEGSVLDSPS